MKGEKMKKAVIYYSLEGNTQLVANLIAKKLDADVISLIPEKQYYKTGFKKFFWGGKSVIFNEKPKLKNESILLEDYDVIILGTPVWAGSYAPPINTFLSENSLSDKRVYLIACHAGDDAGKILNRTKKYFPQINILGMLSLKSPKDQNKDLLEQKIEEFINKIL